MQDARCQAACDFERPRGGRCALDQVSFKLNICRHLTSKLGARLQSIPIPKIVVDHVRKIPGHSEQHGQCGSCYNKDPKLGALATTAVAVVLVFEVARLRETMLKKLLQYTKPTHAEKHFSTKAPELRTISTLNCEPLPQSNENPRVAEPYTPKLQPSKPQRQAEKSSSSEFRVKFQGWLHVPLVWSLRRGTFSIPLVCPITPKGTYFRTLKGRYGTI